MKQARGLSLIEIVVIVAAVAVLLYFLMPKRTGHTDYPRTRTRADLHTITTAIEAYYVDNKVYPPMQPLSDFTAAPEQLEEIGGAELSTVQLAHLQANGITSPVAYLSSGIHDYMLRENGNFSKLPYAYYTNGNDWILFSSGPDEDYDIRNPAELPFSNHEEFSKTLSAITYDPTNGTASGGDIWQTQGT